MKLLFIHNNYASDNSGEEHAINGLAKLLEINGHEIKWYRKTSNIIKNSLFLKIKAFFSGIFSVSSYYELKKIIESFNPDIIQIQNLYPFISPGIIHLIKKKNIPIVMRCPNYRLFCPTGLHLDAAGEVCELCLSTTKEFNCIRKNCERSFFKSLGYALRNFFARTFWGIYKDIDRYIVQSNFQKSKFIKNGISEGKIFVVPGLTPTLNKVNINENPENVSFIGRVSIEKGILEFLSCAKELSDIPFVVVGEVSKEFEYLVRESPQNVQWKGFLSGEKLDNCFQDSKIIIVPSKWYEGFPNVITRAMKHSKPVITSNIGAMSSIKKKKKNGLLFQSGNSKDLEKKIRFLYYNNSLCKIYGENAFLKAQNEYSSQNIYNSLYNVYKDLK